MVKRTKANTQLAKAGDPLVTGDGRIFYEDTADDKAKQADDRLSHKNFKAFKKRNLTDLPGHVDLIKAVSCVFMFASLGVGDSQICEALKITKIELEQIRKHSAYSECFNLVVGEFVNANSSLLQTRLAAFSQMALTQVADLSMNGKKEETKLSASKDLLDRAGVNKKQVDKNNLEDGNVLRIQVTEGDKTFEINLNGSKIAEDRTV